MRAGPIPENIDQYIAGFPETLQQRLQSMRQTIQQAAPAATEAIRYAMPTFRLERNLVHFAAFKNHIGLYPGAGGVKAFEKELKNYVTSKGAIQFPHEAPLPLALVKKIVQFRVKEEQERAKR